MNSDYDESGEDDPYALKFGVATRKDRNFYKLLESVEEEGGENMILFFFSISNSYQ